MATANPSSDFAGSQTQFKRCVGCNILQPGDGRILNCVHIVCLACLNDNVADGGCFKCCLCGEKTTPHITGVDLARQLPLSTATLDDVPSVLMSSDTTSLQCEWCDESKVATHTCLDCAGAGLCKRHAEKHTKSKVFSKHVLRELAANDTKHRTTADSNAARPMCLLHNKHQVSKYCQTCCHTVCERCVTVSHRSHTFESIESAADVQRRVIQSLGFLQPEEEAVEAAESEQLVTRMSEKMDDVQRQKKAASNIITNTFDKAAKMLLAQKEKLLAEVDSLAWRQLKPLELKKSKLASITDQHTMALELSKRLAKSDSNPHDVLRLSHVLKNRQEKMKGEMKVARVVPIAGDITTGTAPLSQLSKLVESLVSVSIQMIDMSKTVIDLPACIDANKEATAKVQLFDGQNKQVHPNNLHTDVEAILLLPSGNRQYLIRATVVSETQPCLEFTFTPESPGKYRLELCYHGQQTEAKFEVKVPLGYFDAAKCSPIVSIFDGGRVVRHTGLAGRVNGGVLSRDGYTKGRHQWRVLVKNGADNTHSIAVGVTVLPVDGNYMSTLYFFTHRRYYQWWCNGNSRSSSSSEPVNTSPWRDGDFLTLTLDCDEGRLELHLQRTDETCAFNDVDCHEPLYPIVNLYHPGQEVETISFTGL